MVFCYKLITDSPRRSIGTSPRKKSPSLSIHNVPSSLSQLLYAVDYESNSSDILNSIPEREWRLLAALAKKREEDDEREQLADQFRRMWQKEKQERELVEAETNEQYKRYITRKRREERAWHEYKQNQISMEHQLRRRQLVDWIRDKEKRSAETLAWVDDKKMTDLIDKALEEEARSKLAATRRCQINEADQCRRMVQLIDNKRRADDAGKKRNAILRNASQRLAISNALSTWETSLLRQEVSVFDAARRATHAAHAAYTAARSASFIRAREVRTKRGRKLAAITAQLREAIRSGRR